MTDTPRSEMKADQHPKRTDKSGEMNLQQKRECIDGALCRYPYDPVCNQVREIEAGNEIRRPLFNGPIKGKIASCPEEER